MATSAAVQPGWVARKGPRALGAWPLAGRVVPMLCRPLVFVLALVRYGDVVQARFGRLPVYFVTHHDVTAVIRPRWRLRYVRGVPVREVAAVLVRPSELPMTAHLRIGAEAADDRGSKGVSR